MRITRPQLTWEIINGDTIGIYKHKNTTYGTPQPCV